MTNNENQWKVFFPLGNNISNEKIASSKYYVIVYVESGTRMWVWWWQWQSRRKILNWMLWMKMKGWWKKIRKREKAVRKENRTWKQWHPAQAALEIFPKFYQNPMNHSIESPIINFIALEMICNSENVNGKSNKVRSLGRKASSKTANQMDKTHNAQHQRVKKGAALKGNTTTITFRAASYFTLRST